MRSNPQIQTTLRRWGIVIFLLVVMAILVFGIIILFDIDTSSNSLEFIPISLQSNLSFANDSSYFSGEIAVVEMSIIDEALADQSTGEDGSGVGSDEISNDLLTPVPTVTTAPSHTPTVENSSGTPPTATNTSDSNPTDSPSRTYTPTINPSSSASPIPTSSPTAQVSFTPSQTITPFPSPSSTLTPSQTPSPTIVPSATFTSTLTPTLTLPPSATPRPDICTFIEVIEFSIDKNRISWTVFNGTSEDFLLEELRFDWPLSNKQLKKIKINGKTIWSEKDKAPPTYVLTEWDKPPSRREISAGSTFKIEFEFDTKAMPNGYYLELNFTNHCKVFAEK